MLEDFQTFLTAEEYLMAVFVVPWGVFVVAGRTALIAGTERQAVLLAEVGEAVRSAHVVVRTPELHFMLDLYNDKKWKLG